MLTLSTMAAVGTNSVNAYVYMYVSVWYACLLMAWERPSTVMRLQYNMASADECEYNMGSADI